MADSVGIGRAGALHAFFTPSEVPVVTVWPPWCRAGAGRAARWTLAAHGQAHLGGDLVVVSDVEHHLAARLAAARAVDDAVLRGRRPR
ncbi:hypothetical protein [Actinokineospora pegani]|uniref:hypothetical protein n=1 Tax=Actinokineospora pegani TaxID=2654637 RepID=UPI0012E9A605|nr:hypothetical protein [Actinokineospora pegani]